MNPMTNVKNVKKLSEEELKGRNKTSWHDQYRGSAWIFVGGLPYDLTEGDIVCVFSQYGEPVNINLVRDKDSGKSKGFCFICYEDQRSTDLAVDNLNGIKILGRTIRVDHVENYKLPKNKKEEEIALLSKVKEEKTKIEDNDIKKTEGNDHSSHSKASKNIKTKEKLSDQRHKKKSKKKTSKSEPKVDKRRKKKKKAESSDSESSSASTSSSSSSDSDSDSSSSSSSSSSSKSSSSTDKEENHKKKKKTKKAKNENENAEKHKQKRTIEDLKREARLIQAELKRRQQLEEKSKKSNSEKYLSERKRSRSCSNEEEIKHKSCRDKQDKRIEKVVTNDKSRHYSKKLSPRDRRRSRTPEKYRHEHRRRY